jgi:hypothetical protein
MADVIICYYMEIRDGEGKASVSRSSLAANMADIISFKIILLY